MNFKQWLQTEAPYIPSGKGQVVSRGRIPNEMRPGAGWVGGAKWGSIPGWGKDEEPPGFLRKAGAHVFGSFQSALQKDQSQIGGRTAYIHAPKNFKLGDAYKKGSTMIPCEKCGFEASIYDWQNAPATSYVRRRNICPKCGASVNPEQGQESQGQGQGLERWQQFDTSTWPDGDLSSVKSGDTQAINNNLQNKNLKMKVIAQMKQELNSMPRFQPYVQKLNGNVDEYVIWVYMIDSGKVILAIAKQ